MLKTKRLFITCAIALVIALFARTTDAATLIAVAGTSLDADNRLQLDGTLPYALEGPPVTVPDGLDFVWQIEGKTDPRTGAVVSVADLCVGDYMVTLTVSGGGQTAFDAMFLGVPAEVCVVIPTPDALQQATLDIKTLITGFPTTSFNAPNSQAAENRRTALLDMLDGVYISLGSGDYQLAIDQLRDILSKVDGLGPPDSAPDWVTGADATAIAQGVSDLITDILLVCPGCS